MYMRGVFFVLFCLLLTSNVQAFEYAGELTAMMGTMGVSSALSLDLAGNLAGYDYLWGLDLDFDHLKSPLPNVATRWKYAGSILANLQINLNHNQEHFTSGGLFRLINKNQYTAESYSVTLQSPQLSLGLLRQVPFKSRDVVDALFLESTLEVGNVSIYGLQLKYAGTRESGSAGVLQAGGKLGSFDVEAAAGWQVDLAGKESQARVFEFEGGVLGFSGRLNLQRIDPGFLSLLAKTNRYTPNRQGWELELSREYPAMEIGLNVRRHTNLDRSRNYHKLAWNVDLKDKNTSLEWRVQPTPALRMRYSLGDTLFQLDPLNATLRTDFKVYGATISLRVDALRQIGRIEYRSGETLQCRLIGKYDFLKDRFHYSCLIKHNHLQLEIGEYDRGSLSSGFDNFTSFCISWAWRF